jgi:hypothetical protein
MVHNEGTMVIPSDLVEVSEASSVVMSSHADL